MKCPHCLNAFHSNPNLSRIGSDSDFAWQVSRETCPECHKMIIRLQQGPMVTASFFQQKNEFLVYPKGISRSPLPKSVGKKFAEDYNESSLVLADSPKASAALSRRCLQNLLREKAGVKPGDLYDEIQEVLDSKQLPSYLAKDIDAVRSIGNFSAHPNKSKTTGEVIDVEPGEAEWNLDVLEGLFDFYFVQEEKANYRKAELNKKLKDAGKNLMK